MTFFPFFSDTPRCQHMRETLWTHSKEIFVDDISEADAILVGWGDGTMLRALRVHSDAQKPFFGINCGTLWFLMNRNECLSRDVCPIPLWHRSLEEMDLITISSIDVSVTTVWWEVVHGYAFNDIVIWGTVLDYMHATIDHADGSHKMSGTWCIITTSLWCTWYALNNGLPLIPLGSSLRWVSGLATGSFTYTYLTPGETHISLTSRSSMMVWLDGTRDVIQDVVSMTLKPGRKHVTLAFLKSEEFAHRRIFLAEQKMRR